MWVLEKLRDTISLDLSQFTNIRPSHLHNNIITPEKIPKFCLPPRLCRNIPTLLLHPDPQDLSVKEEKASRTDNLSVTRLYERPNTRRKESLFHSRRPMYLFERSPGPPPPPRTFHRAAAPRKSSPQFGSASSLSESPSSSDSSPFSSPCPSPSTRSAGLRGVASCSAMTQTAKRSPQGLCPPPLLFPLDMLHCQGRLPREHVVPLEGRGSARFSIEHYHTSPSTDLPCPRLGTVRLRVVSVEGTGGGALSCALRVCLMPGRRQRQKSATIRQSGATYRFNEDFFFTELEEGEVDRLQVRIKVVDKAGGHGLRREALLGVVTKPLSLLLA